MSRPKRCCWICIKKVPANCTFTESMRQQLQQFLRHENRLVFCLCLALLFGLAYSEMASFNLQASVDQKTYWGLAHFDFEQVVVRKYRVIIPFMAAGINHGFLFLVHLVRPGALSGDFSLRFTFFILNLFFSALWCTLIFAYLRSLECSKIAAFIGTLMVVTCKWTLINAGTPMVDALYCCTLGFAFLGISQRNARMIFWAIIIGPFAKESFLFMLPVIFIASHVPKWKLLCWFALSGILVFCFRYGFDQLTGHPMEQSLAADARHFTYLRSNFSRLFQIGYLNDIIATIGLWFFVPVTAIYLQQGFGRTLRQYVRWYMLLWCAMVFLQMCLSGDMARMLYLIMPVYAWIVALPIDALRYQLGKRSINL